MPELTKLLSTKSMMRYFPPNGTAGLARSLVSGYSRVPFPPASTIPNTRIRIGLSTKALLFQHASDWQAPGCQLWSNRSMSQMEFQTAAVIGTGMMGPGIALTLALGGVHSTILSRTAENGARGLEKACR